MCIAAPKGTIPAQSYYRRRQLLLQSSLPWQRGTTTWDDTTGGEPHGGSCCLGLFGRTHHCFLDITNMKIRWGLRMYELRGKLPFGKTVSYSPAEDRPAWKWYVAAIKQSP